MTRVLPGRPRLLPLTMAGLAALFVVKSAGLVGAAYGAAETTPTGKEAAVGTSPASAKAPAMPAAVAGATANDPAEARAVAQAAAQAAARAATPVGATAEPMASPTERALLVDLRKRRSELDVRTAALEQREAVLGAAEKRLGARLDELTSLQKRLQSLESARRDRDEASWRGLVRVYETMKPKDAAVIFNDLDPAVLLQVADRMRDGKLASILAAMAPDRARRLTGDLSSSRSRANAPPVETAAVSPSVPAPPASPGAAMPRDAVSRDAVPRDAVPGAAMPRTAMPRPAATAAGSPASNAAAPGASP